VSIQDGQASTSAPSDATVRKRSFRDKFVIFRRRSKRIALFLESVNFSTCVYMQIFNFRGHVTFLGTIQGPIFAKCLVPDTPD